jgi:hypothetical protein
LSEPRSLSDPRGPNVEELTEREMALMERMFSNPRVWPDRAKVWIADYVSQNLSLPISQVLGFTTFVAQTTDPVNTAEATGSTSYTNLATVGPTLTGISDGLYVVLFGCRISHSLGGGDAGLMSVQGNAVAATDTNAINSNATTQVGTNVAFQLHELRANSNTLTAKYRTTAGTATFDGRTMLAIKIGN